MAQWSFWGYAEDAFTPSDFDLNSMDPGGKEMFWLEGIQAFHSLLIWKIKIFSVFLEFSEMWYCMQSQNFMRKIWAKPVLETDGKTGSFSMELTVSARDVAADKTGQLGSVSWRIVKKGTDDIRGAGTVPDRGRKRNPYPDSIPDHSRRSPLEP